MKKYTWIFFLSLFFACSVSPVKYSAQLTRLNQLLEESPTEVLDSLKKMDVGLLDKKDRAYYYLLEASAIDKNHNNLREDSTLRISENFFAATKDYYNLARTQYYIAKCYNNLNNPQEAYNFLRQAESNLNNSKKQDSHFSGLISYQFGLIFTRLYNHEEAEKYYQHAIDLFNEIQDTNSVILSSRALSWVLISKKEYEKAGKLLEQTMDILQKLDSIDKNTILYKSSILNAQSYFYRKINDYQNAFKTRRGSIAILERHQLPVSPQYYYGILLLHQPFNNIDSIEFYTQKLITSAQQENSMTNIIIGYKFLISIEEQKGNFQKACELKDKYILLKDSLNEQLKYDKILELEKKYNYAEKERLLFKAQNDNLWLWLIILLILIAASIALLYYNWLHRKLKEKNIKLSEEINKAQWGFSLSKELIADNTNSYEELEHFLARHITSFPPKLFNDFQQSLRERKANYSKRLFAALTNINNSFIEKLQKKNPDLNSEEIMLAYMLKLQWTPIDITKVFRITFDAFKKRKMRLRAKIVGNDSSKINLEEYLSKM